ncbi:MAG TPA: PKD domain-containing protein, partial [Chitinophagaceae bacterium]
MRSIRSFVRCFIFTMFLLTVSSAIVKAQYIQTARPNVPINANCNGYMEALPSDYSSTSQSYPLLVFLEGNGETGTGSYNDLQKLYTNGPPKLIRDGVFPPNFTVNGQTFRFIIITPQFVTSIGIRHPSPEEINSIIDYMVQHYRVDQSRIYLTGLSSGGGSVFYYSGASSTYANRLAAIVPFGSTYGTNNQNEWNETAVRPRARIIAAANLPVWAFHNHNDTGVPDTITKDYVNIINEAPTPNPPAKATIFDAWGHDCWSTPYTGSYKENNLNVYEWMLQYKRGTAPANQPPSANAGSDKSITLPTNSVQLNGSGTDPDGSIVSYTWTKVSGGAATIGSPSSATTSITGLVEGTYVFRLTVKDNAGATGTDDVTVVVNPAPNQPPTANAGSDKTITLPTNSVSLSGSGSDADGTITLYNWTKVSGGSATITSPSSASTTITGLVQGTYVFRLRVTDNDGATATDDVTVTVNAAANQPPAVNAGPDKSITLPTSSVSLSGSASDPDGSIASYQWTKVSGGAATITSPSSASTTITGLVQGSYVFRLTVTDNGGATASDDVSVTVNAATNQPPTVNAGP